MKSIWSVLAAAILGSSVTASHAVACEKDAVTWLQSDGGQFLIYGEDTCFGGRPTELVHNGQRRVVALDKGGDFTAELQLVEGSNRVALTDSSGRVRNLMNVNFADGAVTEASARLQASRGNAFWNMPNLIEVANGKILRADGTLSNSPTLDPNNTLGNQPGNNPRARQDTDVASLSQDNSPFSFKVGGLDLTTDATTSARTTTEAPQRRSDWLRVELIWSSPVDLDLHLFEPTAAGPRAVNSNAPGHIWSKASTALRGLANGKIYEVGLDQNLGRYREVYQMDIPIGKTQGGYDILIDYADRTRRANSDPKMCGNGAYANVEAEVRIRTSTLDKTEVITIPALNCDIPVDLKTTMLNIGRVTLR